VFFFLPFALIQVHDYPATLAGTAFLPFTIILAALSRWAGGLLDQFGARLPLTIGPAIAALGIGLVALTVANGSYWEFLLSIAVLGFGMVISVAPLTATVIDAVPEHASVANLFAIAILGAVALSILDHALARNLQNAALSEGAKHAILAARGQFVIEPALSDVQAADRANAALILKGSLAESFKWVMLIAAAIALGAATAGTLIPPRSSTHQ
jgi:MFS family permease